MERFRFNTMLAALMEFTNYLGKAEGERPRRCGRLAGGDANADAAAGAHRRRTSPRSCGSAPGNAYSIHNQPWPQWDEELAAEEEITLVVQVNGKLRDRILVPVDVTEEQAKELALASEKVKAHIGGKQVRRVVYAAGRLVNVVVG